VTRDIELLSDGGRDGLVRAAVTWIDGRVVTAP
jgi:hypothetical protein